MRSWILRAGRRTLTDSDHGDPGRLAQPANLVHLRAGHEENTGRRAALYLDASRLSTRFFGPDVVLLSVPAHDRGQPTTDEFGCFPFRDHAASGLVVMVAVHVPFVLSYGQSRG